MKAMLPLILLASFAHEPGELAAAVAGDVAGGAGGAAISNAITGVVGL
jgi:hypothetical protein